MANPQQPLIHRIAAVIRRIMGAPDYERYVAHMTAHHPECEVLNKDAFVRERMNDRYSRPGSRCC
ncbi:MAG: YbdD/YjiX family protein [Gemmatimonadaceae bacterium]